MQTALEGSLQRMNTDYVDLYQLHWPQREVNKFGKLNFDESMFDTSRKEEEYIVEVLKAFEKLQKS